MRSSILFLAVPAFGFTSSVPGCPALTTITSVVTETATVFEEVFYSSNVGNATLQHHSSLSYGVTSSRPATAEESATSAKTPPTSTATQELSSSKASTSISSSSTASSSSVTPTTAPASTKETSTTKASSTAPAADASSSSSSSRPSSTSTASGTSVTGKSTFYGGNLSGGHCSFTTYTLPSGLYGTAFSGTSWDASECGACLQVTGPNGNSIKVMVVDECPECETGHLDLFQNAFAELGEISAGIIETSYVPIACGITSPLVLHSKTGTSAYWFSMQVVNANEPVESLEVSIDGGSTWQSTTRRTYNFFEYSSGFGTESVDVRVTSVSGGTVEVGSVSVASDAETTASANFS